MCISEFRAGSRPGVLGADGRLAPGTNAGACRKTVQANLMPRPNNDPKGSK